MTTVQIQRALSKEEEQIYFAGKDEGLRKAGRLLDEAWERMTFIDLQPARLEDKAHRMGWDECFEYLRRQLP